MNKKRITALVISALMAVSPITSFAAVPANADRANPENILSKKNNGIRKQAERDEKQSISEKEKSISADEKAGEGHYVKKERVKAGKNTDNWIAEDFTYNSEGNSITGLSDSGKAKLKLHEDVVVEKKDAAGTTVVEKYIGNNSAVVLPDKSTSGVVITSIGDGINGVGTLGIKEIDGAVTKIYQPTSVQFPSKLETVGKFAFSAAINTVSGKQVGLTSIDLPNTVKEIAQSAFMNVPVNNVSIPDSVTSMGAGAFTSAEKAQIKLNNVKLSSGLKEIPAAAFSGQSIKDLMIPEGVTNIGARAFAGNFIKSLTLPNSLTNIDKYAFQNHALTELTIPGNVKKIGNQAFQIFTEGRPHTLASLTLSEGLTEINSKAFAGSILNKVKLPNSVTLLKPDAFLGNKLSGKDAKVTLLTSSYKQAKGIDPYSNVTVNGTGHILKFLGSEIKFDANGGKAKKVSEMTDEEGRLTKLPDAERNGCAFDGWYTEKTGGDKVSVDTIYPENTTLYAHWSVDVDKIYGTFKQQENEILSLKKIVAELQLNARPLKLRVERSRYDSAVITWENNEKADGYEVTDMESGRRERHIENDNRYRCYHLIPGEEYEYRVRAYISVNDEKVYGTPETIKVIPSIEKPELKLTNQKGKKIKAEWKRVIGAYYYQISISTSKGKTSLKSKRCRQRSYTESKLKKGKTYYVKVRAVAKCKDSRRKIVFKYGGWSKVKKIKIKK